LQVSIDIHLDSAVADGFADLFLRAAAAAVEYKIDGFGSGLQLFFDVVLAVLQDDGAELHIAGLYTP